MWRSFYIFIREETSKICGRIRNHWKKRDDSSYREETNIIADPEGSGPTTPGTKPVGTLIKQTQSLERTRSSCLAHTAVSTTAVSTTAVSKTAVSKILTYHVQLSLSNSKRFLKRALPGALVQ